MSFGWVIAGIFGQLVFAAFLFIFSVFGSAGAGDNASRKGITLSAFQSWVIDWSIYVLPALCVLCAAIVFYWYKNGGGAASYWWHLPPILAAVGYFFVITGILE